MRGADLERAAPGSAIQSAMNALKQGIWGLWIGCLAAILLGHGIVASLGGWILGLSLAVHVVEFFVHIRLFRRVAGSLGHHFVQTLIYGLFHWAPIKQRVASITAG
jgi:hypothetical protein